MAQAIRIHAPGGPEALTAEEITPAKPKAGEVLVRHTAIGVNFIDVYHRTGLYKQPSYPAGIGLEGAGIVEEAGQGVALKKGDRVAYCGGPIGSYATHRLMAEKFLVKIPDGISDDIAAAAMLKGLTAHYLLFRTFKVERGYTVLIHAAAGGVGLIMCQWAKHLGATVIGTVGTEEKKALALKHGCDHAVIYTKENIPARVKEITKGQGVEVVYDSVGKATFMDSLDALKKFGMMVSYGNASGAVPPFEPLLLSSKGSLYFTRPNLMNHIEDTNLYRDYAADLFALIGQGILKITIGGKYTLSEAAQAHRDLEARKTTGSLLLIPS